MPIRDSAVSSSAARFRAVLEACSARNAQLFSDTRVIQTGRRRTSSVVPPCRHAGAEPKAVWCRSEAPRVAGAMGFTPIVFRPVPGATSSAPGQGAKSDLCIALLEQRRVFMHRLFKQPWRARARLDAMRPSVRRSASVCRPGCPYAQRLLSLG